VCSVCLCVCVCLQPFCSGALAELPAVPGGDPHAWSVPPEERAQRRDLTGPDYFVARCVCVCMCVCVCFFVRPEERAQHRDLPGPDNFMARCVFVCVRVCMCLCASRGTCAAQGHPRTGLLYGQVCVCVCACVYVFVSPEEPVQDRDLPGPDNFMARCVFVCVRVCMCLCASRGTCAAQGHPRLLYGPLCRINMWIYKCAFMFVLTYVCVHVLICVCFCLPPKVDRFVKAAAVVRIMGLLLYQLLSATLSFDPLQLSLMYPLQILTCS